MKLILISCEFLLELMKNFRPNATISVKLENSVKSNLGMYCVNIKCTYLHVSTWSKYNMNLIFKYFFNQGEK